MKASDMLRQNNGLKTTQSVLNKQQSGVDAAQKVAQTQAPVFTQQQLDAAGKKIDQINAATPTDGAMKAARAKTIATQQAIANGVDVNQTVPSDEEDKPSVPIVKKEEPKPQAKQLSYADMYKMLNPEQEETAEQKERREKKERTKARIAAIGDGLRALSNIYFATKGAKVVHNPESDMTKVVNKRKEYMDAQRERNQAAWLAGYQRAMALDEEARKNDLTLAEQMRYHDMRNDIDKVKNDQGQQRIDQGNRRLDLSKMKYQSDADYKKAVLAIRKALADGQISYWQAQEAIQRMKAETGRIRANKSGSGGSRTGSYSGEVDEYMDLMEKDPEGMAEAAREVKKMGYSPKTAAGKKAQKIAYQRKHGRTKKSHTPSTNKGGKKTGVNW
nr:MAG TPA: hypothetical protein [Caudoviricetes sp.]